MSKFSSTHGVNIKDNTSNSPPVYKWSGMARVFHWVSAILLVIVWAMHALDSATEGSNYLMLHKAFGVSLLFWMSARIIYRLISKVPPALPSPSWQKVISHLTHFALYVLLLAMPIAGILMSWYSGRGIDMFGLFEIPSLLETNRSQARYFNNLHTEIFWPALLIFTGLHIAGAMFHQFIQKDNIMARMK